MHRSHIVALLLRVVLVAVTSLSFPLAATAQQRAAAFAECPPTGCTFAVDVSPYGGVLQNPPNSGPCTAQFSVENTATVRAATPLPARGSGSPASRSPPAASVSRQARSPE